jgi:hypothetical protein
MQSISVQAFMWFHVGSRSQERKWLLGLEIYIIESLYYMYAQLR